MVMSVYLILKFLSGVKSFKEGREEIGHSQHPGQPSASKTDANIEKASEIVRQNLA
jgi:hypothetical protein